MKRTEPCRHERYITARNVTAYVLHNKRMGGQAYLAGEEGVRHHLGLSVDAPLPQPQHFTAITFCSNPCCERVRRYEVSRG